MAGSEDRPEARSEVRSEPFEAHAGRARDARVDQLLAWAGAHVPIDPAERDALTHLRRLAPGPLDPFARTTSPAHITASAVVLDPREMVMLLHLHRRLSRWLQPGGHVETDEPPQDAALRETLEETGVAVRHPHGGPTIVHLDEHAGPDGHIHLDLRYLLLADRHAPRLGAGETTGEGPGATLRWATLPEVTAMGDPSVGRAVIALDRHLERAAAQQD